jgi:parvulin-like peptidyl-prolyl isomerase
VRRVALLVLCTLALGAGCAKSTSRAAATINGHAVSTRDLVDELNAIEANKDFINSLQGQKDPQTGALSGITVEGSKPGSFDAAFVSQVLLRQLDYALIRAEVEKRHIVIDDACRLEAKNDAQKNLGQSDQAAGQKLFDEFPKQYQDVLISRNADVIALEAALSGQQCAKPIDAKGYYDTHPDDFTKLCVSVIAVADQATADDVVAQARAGADFTTLVHKYSTDDTTKATDGAIGCELPSAFNNTVAPLLQAAKTGEVLDPIPGQSGFSIVKVTDRQLAALADVQSQAEELVTATQQQSFSTWLSQARAGATVTVDPRYGTFDPATFHINPPGLDVHPSDSSSSTDSSSSDTP